MIAGIITVLVVLVVLWAALVSAAHVIMDRHNKKKRD